MGPVVYEAHGMAVMRNGRAVSPSGASKISDSPNNARAFIDNPFNDVDPSDLDELVRGFVEAHGLADHLQQFEKAALLARDSGAIYNEDVFSESERRIIKPFCDDSAAGKIKSFWAFARAWRQEPKQLQVIILACALAAVIQ